MGSVFFFQAEDGIRDIGVTGVQTCALPISDCVREALSLAGMVRPDVTLVGFDGQGPLLQDLVRELTGMGVRVVLLGEAGAGSDLVDVLRAGARGYVHTTASPHRLVGCVRAVRSEDHTYELQSRQ